MAQASCSAPARLCLRRPTLPCLAIAVTERVGKGGKQIIPTPQRLGPPLPHPTRSPIQWLLTLGLRGVNGRVANAGRSERSYPHSHHAIFGEDHAMSIRPV